MAEPRYSVGNRVIIQSANQELDKRPGTVHTILRRIDGDHSDGYVIELDDPEFRGKLIALPPNCIRAEQDEMREPSPETQRLSPERETDIRRSVEWYGLNSPNRLTRGSARIQALLLSEISALRTELAAATAREAKLRRALEWSLTWTPKKFETPLVQSWRDKADALLAEPNTTSGEAH